MNKYERTPGEYEARPVHRLGKALHSYFKSVSSGRNFARDADNDN